MSWSPSSVSPLLWLDAADASTITTDAFGNITEWADKSVANRDATQDATIDPPTYAATGFNGRPGVMFSPNQRLNTGGTYFNNVTFFFVFNRPSASVVSLPLGNKNDIDRRGMEIDANGTIRSYLPSINSHGSALTDTGDMFFAVQRDGTDANVFYNGTEVTSWTQRTTTTDSLTLDSVGYGRFNYHTGAIAEIIVTSDVTAVTRQKLEGYAAHKWGLAALLPSDHPYKNSPPIDATVSAPAPLVNPRVFAIQPSAADGYVSVPAPGLPAIQAVFEQEFAWVSAPSPLAPIRAYGISDFQGFGYPQVYYWAEFGDLKLPISSWQATLQIGERSSYVQCVVPAALQYFADIAAIGVGGKLAIIRGEIFPNGDQKESEVASVSVSDYPYQRGPNRETVTLSGYGRLSFIEVDSASPGATRQLPGVQTITVQNGVRVRCDVDWVIRPGMTAIADGVDFTVSYINYYVNQNQQFMDVGERTL